MYVMEIILLIFARVGMPAFIIASLLASQPLKTIATHKCLFGCVFEHQSVVAFGALATYATTLTVVEAAFVVERFHHFKCDKRDREDLWFFLAALTFFAPLLICCFLFNHCASQPSSTCRASRRCRALRALCAVQIGLRTFSAAREAIGKTLVIAEELGLQQNQDYGTGTMLMGQGRVDLLDGCYKEALVTFHNAKSVLSRYKEHNEYKVLLSDMSYCHVKLDEWNDAVTLSREALQLERAQRGTDYPEYAVSLYTTLGACMPTLSNTRSPFRALRRHSPSSGACLARRIRRLFKSQRNSPRSGSSLNDPIVI